MTRVELSCQAFTLDNGLRVLVHEDPASPIAAVNVWYHVGSANEPPGRTGFAHLFEHLMFEGSQHVAEGEFDERLESAGGINNGSTSADRTNYWETVPPASLELALWLEADRMGWLLPAMTQEKLDLQRSVVKNERRQSYENRPYGLAFEKLVAALYPPGHPYHHPTIGSMADLDAATIEDVAAFFRTYYAPNNASLAVAGPVGAGEVRTLVERHFGAIPRGPAVPLVRVPDAVRPGAGRFVLEDDVELPRLYLAWQTPRLFAPGDAALDIAAHVLGDGRASRLYRRLVYEEQVAQDVDAHQNSEKLASTFAIVATAKPGVPLARLERGIREELARLAREAPDGREVERARNGLETGFVDALQTVGGFGGRADRLNHYLFYAGDPGWSERDLARYDAVSASELRAVVAASLVDAGGVALGVVPRGRADLAHVAA